MFRRNSSAISGSSGARVPASIRRARSSAAVSSAMAAAVSGAGAASISAICTAPARSSRAASWFRNDCNQSGKFTSVAIVPLSSFISISIRSGSSVSSATRSIAVPRCDSVAIASKICRFSGTWNESAVMLPAVARSNKAPLRMIAANTCRSICGACGIMFFSNSERFIFLFLPLVPFRGKRFRIRRRRGNRRRNCGGILIVPALTI